MSLSKLFGIAILMALIAGTGPRALGVDYVKELDAKRESPKSLLFGVNMVANPHIVYRPAGYQDDVFQQLGYLGGTMVRLCASMREIEKVRGTRDWTHLDEEINRARAAGMEPMMLICNTPVWALPETPGLPKGMDPTYQYPYADEYLPEFEDFCRELGERTKGRIRLFQIWNEANGCSWHFHDGFNHADEYVPMLVHGYKGLKKGNPDAVVLLTSLDDAEGHAPIFLNKVYDIRDKEYPGQRLFDGLTDHPYDKDMDKKKAKLVALHEILKKNGDGDLPIYITEYGWRTGAERDGEKVEYVKQTLELFQQPDLGFLKGAIMLALADFEGEPGFGLTDENLRPRESFYAFQGAPKFGSSPPFRIHWRPLTANQLEVTCETVMPSIAAVQWADIGDGKREERDWQGMQSADGKTHRTVVRLPKGLDPKLRHEFRIRTIPNETKRAFITPPYEVFPTLKGVFNGGFNQGNFAGIADGWRIVGNGLSTVGIVWPGPNLKPGDNAQVMFSVPERDLRLHNTAYAWVIPDPEKTMTLTVGAVRTSLQTQVPVKARIGLDPKGLEDVNAPSIVWSSWTDLKDEWQTLTVSAKSDAPVMTVLIQGQAEDGEKGTRPAMAFDNVRVAAK